MNPYSTANVTAIRDRASAIAKKIRELQKENPSWSYDRAWNECKKLPEMQDQFDAMRQPEALSAPAKNPEQVKATAVFRGKVQTAIATRGISYDEAWTAVRAEEPEIYTAMVGENDPVKRIKEQNGWRD